MNVRVQSSALLEVGCDPFATVHHQTSGQAASRENCKQQGYQSLEGALSTPNSRMSQSGNFRMDSVINIGDLMTKGHVCDQDCQNVLMIMSVKPIHVSTHHMGERTSVPRIQSDVSVRLDATNRVRVGLHTVTATGQSAKTLASGKLVLRESA